MFAPYRRCVRLAGDIQISTKKLLFPFTLSRSALPLPAEPREKRHEAKTRAWVLLHHSLCAVPLVIAPPRSTPPASTTAPTCSPSRGNWGFPPGVRRRKQGIRSVRPRLMSHSYAHGTTRRLRLSTRRGDRAHLRCRRRNRCKNHTKVSCWFALRLWPDSSGYMCCP